ncbi:VWA domain-containing protein [Brachyspira intermedia]|uniref:vWA domain-containing protein n=1 Tax=Brachyspira intermedia TaxID=84377 RepID=UPI003003E0B7
MEEEILSIREKELRTNPSARVAVCLVLDTSGSMSGAPINELNRGVKLFIDAIKNDDIAKYAAEIAIVTFGGDVEVYADFANIENLQFTDFYAEGSTPMEEAVTTALNLLETRKKEYVSAGIDYYQPWMVIMSDGQPDTPPTHSSSITYQMASNRKLACFQIGIGSGADMQTLAKFSPRKPLVLNGLNFAGLFEWLSKSIQAVSQSTVGDTVNLQPLDPSIGTTWETV